jgi:hypothetical protein
MIKTVSSLDVEVDRKPQDFEAGDRNPGSGRVIGHATYFGPNRAIARGPQGFFTDFGPNFLINPHFHRVDQFQIIVRGEAKLGKQPLVPVTIHYADGFTPYGPIVCGAEGMAFFNLRSHSDVGGYPMPGSRAELERRAGRTWTEHTRLALDDQSRSLKIQSLVDLQDDGLGAFEIVAGPGVSLLSDVVAGACRYELILAGSLEIGGQSLPRHSCVFASAGEVLDSRRAGPDGVHLLDLQLPYA